MKGYADHQVIKKKEDTVAATVGLQLAYIIMGFIFSRTAIFSGFMPFGIAAAAACPASCAFATVFGAGLGYAIPLPGGGDGLRYIAAVIMVAMLRRFLPKIPEAFKGISALIISASTLLSTAAIVALIDRLRLAEIVLLTAEALLAGGSAYFIERCLSVLNSKSNLKNLSQYEITSFVITLSIALMSLSTLAIAGISPARIAAIVAILIAARFGREASGAIVGISTGFAISITSPDLGFIAGGYAIGGLVAGVFSPLGSLASCIAFFIVNSVVSINAGVNVTIIITIYEAMIASAIFLALPQSSGRQLAGIFEPKSQPVKSEGFKRSVLMRLDFASAALKQVSESVEAVAYKLRRRSVPVVDDVFENVRKDVCVNCTGYCDCFNKGIPAPALDFNRLSRILKEYGKIETALLPSEFFDLCKNPKDFSKAATDCYAQLILKKTANTRIDEFRSIVIDQFDSLSGMLSEMAESIHEADKTDVAAEEKINSILRNMGLTPLDVSCNISRNDSMLVEIRLQGEISDIDKPRLTKELSRASGRELESLSVTSAGKDILISLSEKTELKASFGAAQHVCNNSQLCGDAFEYFFDGRGHAIALISDGMGSGGRAAVDGAMAAGLMSRLIKAGFGFESSIKIVNSAMLFKSVDESLATVDAVCVNLFSGRSEFYKAGAPITFIRRKNQIGRIESKSLPIGILKDIQFEKTAVALDVGDIVVMLTDGAIDVNTNWIEEEILAFDNENDVQELAEIIAAKAKTLRGISHDDDITVLALQIQSNQNAA